MNPDKPQPPRAELELKLSSLILGELPADEAFELGRAIEQDVELAKIYRRLKKTVELVRETTASPAEEKATEAFPMQLSAERREKLLQQFKTVRPKEFVEQTKPGRRRPTLLEIAAIVAVLGILAAVFIPMTASLKMTKGNRSASPELSWWYRKESDASSVQTSVHTNTAGAAFGVVNSSKPATPQTTVAFSSTASDSRFYSEVNRNPGAKILAEQTKPRDPGAAPQNEFSVPRSNTKIILPPTEGSDVALNFGGISAGATATFGYQAEPAINGTASPGVGGVGTGGGGIAPGQPAAKVFFAGDPASVGTQDTDAVQSGAKESDAKQLFGKETAAISEEISQGHRSETRRQLQPEPAGLPPAPAPAPAQVPPSSSALADALVRADSPQERPAEDVERLGKSVELRRVPQAIPPADQSGRTIVSVNDDALTTWSAPPHSAITNSYSAWGDFHDGAKVTNAFGGFGGLAQTEGLDGSARGANPRFLGRDRAAQFPGPVESHINLSDDKKIAAGAFIAPSPLPIRPPDTSEVPVLGQAFRTETGAGQKLAEQSEERDKESEEQAMFRRRYGGAPSTVAPAPSPVEPDGVAVKGLPLDPKTLADYEKQRELGETVGLPGADVPAAQSSQPSRGLPRLNQSSPGQEQDRGDVQEALRRRTKNVEANKSKQIASPSVAQTKPENQDAGKPATEERGRSQEQKAAALKQEVEKLRVGIEQSQTADPAPAPAARPAPIPQPEIQTRDNRFSTFSLNVSDVSFKLAAASLEQGQLPEPAAIRSEEFINAFDYRDSEPAPGVPVAFASELARYPFAQNRDLLRLSIKTGAAGRQAGRPLNLVLLLDNSGSMERADRVRILSEALRVLATQLQPQDKLSVVTFSRTARLWVDGIPGNQATQLADDLSGLAPQGGTNFEEAMKLGYEAARRHYLAQGINRVVLLTDGAANLGNVEPDALKATVEAQRKQGIALDCFGIGWEGYNDDLLETLSRNGDGRYGFINSVDEAATEFAGQLAGALQVAASDVKVQVEFNPSRVNAYRQVGYARHQLTKEQFRDNTVDAAEIAAAEAGNALYVVEVNPRGEGPLGTVRVRYKVPGTTDYREQEWAVPFTGNATPLEQAGPAMRLAASASAFSEWLATSPYASEVTPDRLLGYLSGVSEVYGADARPKKLEWMIRQAKSLR